MKNLACLFCLWILFALPVHAQVKLNEVLPAPATGSEWIEITNTSTASAELSGWQLWDELTTPSLLYSFPTGTFLAAGSFYAIEVSNKLNNAGDGIVLLNAASIQQDRFAYSSSSAQLSWGRIPDGTGIWNLLQTPSRGGPNVGNPSPSPSASPISGATPTPSPSPSPSTFSSTLTPPKLTEFQACPPSGESEWVELSNPNSESITLSNWQLVDGSGNIRLINITLPANGQGSFLLSSAILNNSGDTLLLQTPDDEIVDRTSYSSCETAMTWQLVNGGWLQLFPSRDQPNQLVGTHEQANEIDLPATLSGETSLFASSFPNESPSIEKFDNQNTLPFHFWPSLTYHISQNSAISDSSLHLSQPIQPNHIYAFGALATEIFGAFLQLPMFWRWYTDWRARQKSQIFSDEFF